MVHVIVGFPYVNRKCSITRAAIGDLILCSLTAPGCGEQFLPVSPTMPWALCRYTLFSCGLLRAFKRTTAIGEFPM